MDTVQLYQSILLRSLPCGMSRPPLEETRQAVQLVTKYQD